MPLPGLVFYIIKKFNLTLMKKPLIKKILIGLGILILLLLTPSFTQIFKLYIYNPYTEPAPEDFYVRSEEPPFAGLEPLPKEDVENYYTGDGKTIVDSHRDGYKIILDRGLKPQTRAIESDRMLIYKGDDCRYSIYRLNDTENMTIKEWYERDKKGEEFSGTLTILSYTIEKIDHEDINAYFADLNTTDFGNQRFIIFKNKEGVIFTISQTGEGGECSLYEDVFLNLTLK